MKVPFLDLKAQYATIQDDIDQAIQKVIENTAFASGPFVEAFEKNFAEACQTKHAIGLGSGTEALWLALLAKDIGPGDEVITTPNTFIATAEAISYVGAKPVFVDVDEQTYNINPELIEAAITPKTKAIVPVHLFGQMADMDAVMAIAEKHGLIVIEDACQAHDATYKGRAAGSIGHVGCFSFYPGKNLGAYGDAGGLVTNDDAIAQKVKMLRDHGQEKKYHHGLVGWNARMDGIQGAVLDVKLRHLTKWSDARIANAKTYETLLQDVDEVAAPYTAPDNRHVFHIYAVRVADRDGMLQALASREVYCGIHYPIPLHLQPAYKDLNLPKGSFPVTEKCAAEYLSLPMFPELTEEQVGAAVQEIKNVLAERSTTFAKAS